MDPGASGPPGITAGLAGIMAVGPGIPGLGDPGDATFIQGSPMEDGSPGEDKLVSPGDATIPIGT